MLLDNKGVGERNVSDTRVLLSGFQEGFSGKLVFKLRALVEISAGILNGAKLSGSESLDLVITKPAKCVRGVFRGPRHLRR